MRDEAKDIVLTHGVGIGNLKGVPVTDESGIYIVHTVSDKPDGVYLFFDSRVNGLLNHCTPARNLRVECTCGVPACVHIEAVQLKAYGKVRPEKNDTSD